MMLPMNPVPCRASISRTILCTILSASFFISSALSKTWDSVGAAQAYQEAGQMRSQISGSSQPALSLYLECAKAYRQVHIKDPHSRYSPEALYAEALLYQEMGDRFSSLDFYKTAAKRFQFLVKHYPGNSNCPDALLRMGNIFQHTIGDAIAAQDAFRELKSNYKYSAAARQLSVKEAPAKILAPAAVKPAPLMASEARSTALIESIRHQTTDKYTRVTIQLDSDAKYIKERLSKPERLYFDLADTRIAKDLQAQTISVEDAHLQQIRISAKGQETTRIVLDLAGATDYSISELSAPFRIIVDLFSKEESAARLKKPTAPASGPPASAVANVKPVSSQPKEPPRAITELSPPQAGNNPVVRPAILKEAAKPQAIPEAKSGPVQKESAMPASASIATQTDPVLDARVTLPQSVVEKQNNSVNSSLNSENKNKDVAKASIEPQSLPTQNGPKAAMPTSQGTRTLTRMLGLKIGRIVIDPGHGGHDLGTVGPGGLYEKDLVLSIARELQTLLIKNLGAEVVLTRNEDVFLSLEERSAIANQYRADLFISIHANSSRHRSISGVETYYLDFAKTSAEREIAARENASASSSLHELEDLVKKIAQADRSSESRELAFMVQKSLYAGSRKFIPSTQNRGVRTAPFIVLIGANMPSILVEVAFISNPRVEKLLKSEANKEHVVKALYSGIEDYMKTLGSELVQNRTTIK